MNTLIFSKYVLFSLNKLVRYHKRKKEWTTFLPSVHPSCFRFKSFPNPPSRYIWLIVGRPVTFFNSFKLVMTTPHKLSRNYSLTASRSTNVFYNLHQPMEVFIMGFQKIWQAVYTFPYPCFPDVYGPISKHTPHIGSRPLNYSDYIWLSQGGSFWVSQDPVFCQCGAGRTLSLGIWAPYALHPGWWRPSIHDGCKVCPQQCPACFSWKSRLIFRLVHFSIC